MAPRRPAAAAWAMASTWSARRYVADSPALGLDGVGGLGGEIERLRRRAVGELLGAVGVGADELGLAMPQAGEVERHLGGHAHQHGAPAWPRDPQGGRDRVVGTDGVDHGVGSTGQRVADHPAAVVAAHGTGQLAGRNDVVGAEPSGLALLVRVAGADDDRGLGDVAHEPGDRRQAHRPGAEHGDDRRVGGADRLAAGGEQCGVDPAGERLDEHGALVRHVAEAMQLAVVGDELGSPAATGGRAEPGLDAGFEIAGGEVAVVVAVARRRVLERQREAACGVAEHRFDGHPRAVVELADDLVARHERKRDDVVEVRRGMTLDHRQVGPADSRQPGPDAVPSVAGQLGRIDGAVLERRDPHRGRRPDRRRDAGQPQPSHRPPHLQRLHVDRRPQSECFEVFGML